MHDNTVIAVLLVVFTGVIVLGIIYGVNRRAKLRRQLRRERAEREIRKWNRATCPHGPAAVPPASKKPAASKKNKKDERASAKSASKAKALSVSRAKSVPIHPPSYPTQKAPSTHGNSNRASQAGSAKSSKAPTTIQNEWPETKSTPADVKSQPTHKGSWKPHDAFTNGGKTSQKGANEWDQAAAQGNSKTSQKAEEQKQANAADMDAMRNNDDNW